LKNNATKYLIGLLIVLLLLVRLVFVCLYDIRQKSPDNVPELSEMKDYLTEKGEIYAGEKIEGFDKNTLSEAWGAPTGDLYAADGLAWKVDGESSIVLYFDGDTATRAELLYHEPQDNGLILEPLDAIVPALMVNGELYCYVGESLTGDRCGMMDGAITSTVESWKMPVKDDQSNFGEYSYQYGNEGFIEVLQDGTWYTYLCT